MAASEAKLAEQEVKLAEQEAKLAEAESRLAEQDNLLGILVMKVENIKKIPMPEPRELEEPAKVEEPEPVVEPEPEVEPEQEPAQEEQASPKAALYGKAVDDIRQAISLGDRFLYQRELFGQNAELMQKTLTELNALGTYDEAISYISRFGWDTESSTYQQFLVTLHRRFG